MDEKDISIAEAISAATNKMKSHFRYVWTSRAYGKMFPSLQRLSTHCIWENLLAYEGDINIKFPSKFSPKLKELLIAEFSHFVEVAWRIDRQNYNQHTNEVLCKVLPLLLNDQVAEFAFPVFQNVLSVPMWEIVLDKCPNLKILSVPFGYFEPYENLSIEYTKLEQLVILDLGMVCDEADLCTFAENLPKLSVLRVKLLEMCSGKGFKALSNLQMLEEFTYFSLGDSSLCIDNMKDFNWSCQLSYETTNDVAINQVNFGLSLKFLPKLKVSGFKYLPHHCVPGLKNWLEIGKLANEELQKLEKPCTLGLQELTACSLPDGVAFPNLNALHLCSPRPLECDLRWSTISELGLYSVTMDTSVQIFTQIGKQMKELRIDVMDTLALDVVFKLCPNLKHLALLNGPQQLTCESELDPGSLQQLKGLEIWFYEEHHRVKKLEVGAELLLRILQMPELRELVLVCRVPSQQMWYGRMSNGAEEIIDLFEEDKMLQKLEKATLRLYGGSGKFSKSLKKGMIEYCPKLIRFSFDIRHPIFENCWDV